MNYRKRNDLSSGQRTALKIAAVAQYALVGAQRETPMRYTEGTIGHVFILRLEDRELLNDTIEAFARSKAVVRAFVSFLGGSADGSRVVVGPDAERNDTVVPLDRLHSRMG